MVRKLLRVQQGRSAWRCEMRHAARGQDEWWRTEPMAVSIFRSTPMNGHGPGNCAETSL